MKVAFYILILFPHPAWLSIGYHVKKEVCEELKAGSYPHPDSCSKYISCDSQGNHVIKSCQKKMNFDPELKTCVWESIYNCEMRDFCQDRIDGNYPDLSQCESYIMCVSGIAYRTTCPKGLRYNHLTKQCDWPSNTPCNKILSSTMTDNSETKTKILTSVAPSSGLLERLSSALSATSVTIATASVNESMESCHGKTGNYPIPGQCSSFITCDAKGEAIVTDCPEGLNFHPKHGVCVWNYTYPCIDGTPVEHICIGKSDGLYRDPLHCDRYISCVDELKFPMRCPASLWYDDGKKQCDYQNNVNCAQKSDDVSSETKSSDFCQGRHDGSYQNPNQCRSFFNCNGSVLTTVQCPPNHWYDSEIGRCSYSKDIICEVPMETQFSCEGKTSGAYESAEYCNRFYLCESSSVKPQEKRCPKHTNFYPPTKTCVWSYSYSCTDPDFCMDRMDGKYRNRNNCYGYYECSGGRTFPTNCEIGFRFNGVSCVSAEKFTCPEQ